MANFKFVKTATATVLGASVLTTAVVVPGADASAKTTYKVNQYGYLVNAKTSKKVNGYKRYKGKLYKNGKKFTGKTSYGTYYVKGKRFTGKTKYGYYYVNGKRFTGTTKYGYYYVNGKRFNGKTKYGNLYVNGKRYTGTTKYGYTYYNGKRVEGEYKGKVYANGKLVTGLYKEKLYNKGVLETGLDLYKDKLYKDGVLNVGYALKDGKLYKDADLNKGLEKYEDKYYYDADLANGTYKDENGVEKLYKDGKVVEIAVESVSAINATETTVGVTFDKDVDAAALKDQKITLKGAQTLTATFVKAEGKVATFKIDQDIKGKAAYDGEYTVSADFAIVADGLKTTYSAIISGTFVEGFVFTKNATNQDVPLAGATVKVGDLNTTTDANGYYQLAVNPGVKTVEISKGNEYFVAEEDANVSRNYSTVVNKDLTAIDVTKLFYTGTVLDSKDSTAVAGADVQLQAKDATGQWKDVVGFTAKTDEDGKFAFLNSGATTTLNSDSYAKANASNEVLSVGTEYRVIAKKAVTEDNLDNVYKEQTASFTVSNKKEETTSLLKVDKVAELQELKVNLSWLKDSTVNDDVKVTLLNTDGTTALEDFTLSKDTDFTLDEETGKKFKEAVDVVDKGQFKNQEPDSGSAVKPRLVSGTYFAIVDNGTENAIKAFPIEVTEGGKVSVNLDVEKAQTAQAKTLVDKVQFAKSLYTDPTAAYDSDSNDLVSPVTVIKKDLTRDTTNIQAGYAAYQTVAGKDILIATSAVQNVTVDHTAATVNSIGADPVALNQLAGSVTYKVKSTSDFLVGNKDLTVKPDAATNNVTASVNAATKLKTIEVKDKTTGNPITGTVTVKSLKLVDKDGNTVAEATPNKIVTATEGIINVSDLDATDAAKFTNIKANKYKLSVELAGYKAGTSNETELIDFQNGEISVSLEKIKDTNVTGYVRFANDGNSVADADSSAEASIIAYNKNGDAVAADNFGDDSDTTYSIKGLTAGEEYTFVVRGEGFETQAVKKVVNAEDLTSLNFDVVKGGQGQFKLQLVDTENNNLDNTKINYVAKDAYYDVDLGANDKTGTALAGIDFKGDYAVTTPSGTGTDARTYKIDGVSAGSYKLELANSGTNDKYVLPQTYNLTLKDVNGTAYATSNGTEIIKVPLIDNSTGLNVNINLKVTGDATTTGSSDVDYIQVLDADGNVVTTKRGGFNADPSQVTLSVPNNKIYTVKAYLNNGYVSTIVVPVQNYDANATIDVTQAVR